MSNNSAFSPFGPTYVVGQSPVQVRCSGNMQATSYRFRNLQTSAQYIAWMAAPPGGGPPTFPTVTAPVQGTPQAQTLGLLGTSVEVFSNLPPDAWFQSTQAANFEVTPGEGV